MIDYFFKFTNEAAAIAAASAAGYYSNGVWDLSRCVPDIKVWRVSQDVVGTDATGHAMTTHTYLSGWFGIITSPTAIPALNSNPNLQIAIDRDLAKARQVAIIVNNINAILQDVRFSPVIAGSDYPFGSLQ